MTSATMPDHIWAAQDRATVYMDGSSPVTARDREFPNGTAYVRADLAVRLPDEDDIEEAITGSIDMDWTPRDAARAIMRLLQERKEPA